MRPLILIMALATLASCHSIKRLTTTLTKKTDSASTVTTETRQDTASLSRLISGKDVDITIKYFNGDQLRSYADSFVSSTKKDVEADNTWASGKGCILVRHKKSTQSADLYDFIPDHSRISEITIHAADVQASTTATISSKQTDTTTKKKVVNTDQKQVVSEEKTSVMAPFAKILAWGILGLILLLLILAWVQRKFKIF